MVPSIPEAIRSRMRELEQIDARDRKDGTARGERLRQITADTGRLLTLLVSYAPEGELVELGTSAGYSTLWLSLGAVYKGRKVITFERDPAKELIARETFKLAGIEDQIDMRVEDAVEGIGQLDNIGFCFMDLEKDLYQVCYDLVIPRMVQGGLLVVDNAISHASELGDFLDAVHQDLRVDALVLPVGKGELICRRRAT
jgi:predicted O-methyltransferase YrrM